MEHSIVTLLICSTALVVAASGFEYMRREITRKRNASRMRQALRRGLTHPEGAWTNSAQVLELQS
jgi:hypothetical protein